MDETKKDAAPFLCGFAEERCCAICGLRYPVSELVLVRRSGVELWMCVLCREILRTDDYQLGVD